MRYLSLFSGIGAFEKALNRIGVNYELVGFSEIDKYAIKSYCAIHGVDESLNLGNVSKIDLDELKKLGEIDLITHGSPCQDFSIAGRLAGGDKGSGTRSSLMWCTVDIVEAVRPKYVVWENVKNLLSAKNRHNFDGYIRVMDELGYNSYYQVLNAKNYGIPQNRERVFTVSIRKDIDTGYEFPKGFELTKKLKDVLEKSVDEKYYLSDKIMSDFVTDTKNDIKMIGKLNIKGHDCVKRVYSGEGIAPTLTDMQGGNRQPKIITYNISQKVKVRKYPVNIDELKEVLRNAKTEVNITNNELAEKLKIPKTQVEHYFRKDDCFAIPDPEIWCKLKELLKIDTDKFDKSIITFEEKDGVYDKANRVYDEQGLAPTLTLQETVAVAMRGRYNESGEVEQQIEISDREIANSITTVQKDSMIGEEMPMDDRLRIRKLTPLECWRLMGFDDEDFYKAQSVPTSNTQLYKQAGNSIVVNVLEVIFKNLKIK